MCYPKPGPRCASHAQPAYNHARQRYANALRYNSMTDEIKMTAYLTRRDYFGTEKGQKYAAKVAQGLESLGRNEQAEEIRQAADEAKIYHQQQLRDYHQYQGGSTHTTSDVLAVPADLTSNPNNPVVWTDDQMAHALDSYTVVGYFPINDYLRKGEETEGLNKDHIHALDAMVSRNALTKPMTLYRGVDYTNISDLSLESGMVLEDKGFMSTTSDLFIAETFTDREDGIVFEIDAPKGTPAIDVATMSLSYETESEYILGRGTKLEIYLVERHFTDKGHSYRMVSARLV